MIKLQEAPENIAEGETPTTVTLYAFDDLVDIGRPGDRVEVTGIFRAVPIRSNPRRRSVQSVRSTSKSRNLVYCATILVVIIVKIIFIGSFLF